MVYVDIFQWIADKFGKVDRLKDKEKFDAIIVDALDSITSVNIAFVGSLFNGLSTEGVV